MSSNNNETGSDVSLYGSENELEPETSKISVRIFQGQDDPDLSELYHPVFKLIGADVNLLKIQTSADDNTSESQGFVSVAFVIFLFEDGMLECERIQEGRRQFENPPWTFHHSEEMKIRNINPYPYNSQEFYSTSADLPLWAVRQVHYGKEHLRVMLFVSDVNWYDMLGFYKIIIGLEPEVQRHDFCLYTLSTHGNYDVQFALKRLTGGIPPKPLNKIRIVFKVGDVGQIVPLFPNSSQAISETEWSTTDHDGNRIALNTESGEKETLSPFVRNGPTTKTINGFYV